MNTEKNLPDEILVKIFSKVGKESATLIGNIKLSCKRFNQLTETNLVLQQIQLTPFFNHPTLLKQAEKTLLFQCYEAENPDALLIVGSWQYFLNEEVDEGKNLIEKALPCGKFIATYIQGIMLLCESNRGGIDNLLEVLKDEHGKHWLRNCRNTLRHVVAGTTLFQIPNFQACHKVGMGHWNRDEPYPHGYEEFVVTCKRCSIDLEMFKLVNRLL